MGKLELKIKKAIHKKLLRNYNNKNDVMIINEFEILKGRSRVDIAVLNKYFHGFEIKSDKDNLLRLREQVANYGKVFDKMTLIVGYNHFYEAIQIIPEWWGVKLYTEETKGEIVFHEARKEKFNESRNQFFVLQLLTKTEMISLLKSNNKHNLTGKKNKLSEKIISELTGIQIKKKIKEFLQIRKDLSIDYKPLLNDD